MANALKMHITIICFQNICNSIACNQFTICALWSRSIKKCVLCESESLKSFSFKKLTKMNSLHQSVSVDLLKTSQHGQ